jgi:hypothetical protein
MDSQTVLLIILVCVYAPLIVACINGKRGGGVWKVLTFLLCTIAAAIELFSLGSLTLIAVILWLAAWGTAAATRTAVHRHQLAVRTLEELQKQGLRGIEWVSLGSEGPRKLCIS